MKKTTMFGAMLCSAALAMGMAMPAFAAGASTEGTATASGNNGTASTSVQMAVTNANISATVPLNLYVVSPSTGGALTVPTTYQIENTGSTTIYVASVKTTEKMGWKFSNPANSTTVSANSVELDFKGDDGVCNFSLYDANTSAKSFAAGTRPELQNTGDAIKFVLSGKTKLPTGTNLTASETASEIATVQFTITNSNA